MLKSMEQRIVSLKKVEDYIESGINNIIDKLSD